MSLKLMALAFLCPAEAAYVLDVDKSTIRRMLNSGALQGFRICSGKLWRIRPSALRELGQASEPGKLQSAG